MPLNRAPAPPPHASPGRGDESTRHCQSARRNTGAWLPVPLAGRASWRYCRGKFGAYRYFIVREGSISGGFWCANSAALTFVHGHVLIGILRPEILCAGTNQPVVVELFDDVRRPATDAGDGENRGEKIFVNAEDVVSGSGIEVHVGIQFLFCLHETLDFLRHFIPLRLATGLAQIA